MVKSDLIGKVNFNPSNLHCVLR